MKATHGDLNDIRAHVYEGSGGILVVTQVGGRREPQLANMRAPPTVQVTIVEVHTGVVSPGRYTNAGPRDSRFVAGIGGAPGVEPLVTTAVIVGARRPSGAG